MQVAAAAMVTAKELHRLDLAFRRERARQAMGHRGSMLTSKRIVVLIGVAMFLFGLWATWFMPDDAYIIFVMVIIPGVTPILIVAGLIICGDRHRPGYWGMVGNGVGGVLCFDVSLFGVLYDYSLWLYHPGYVSMAVCLLFYVCPVLLAFFVKSASRNYRVDPPLCPDPPLPPLSQLKL